MLHESFDLFHWVEEFPLARLREEARDFVLRRKEEFPAEYPNRKAVERHIELMSPGGEIVVGPRDLAINMQLRQEAFAGKAYNGPRVPVDVFVWARGEPEIRSVTKVGGLPYWPKDEPWPRDPDGKPIRFLAQICFADSMDIVGPLPGQVLLIFGDEEALFEPERLFFKWLPLGLENLVTEPPPVDPEEALSPFYGVIYRTEDWPEALRVLERKYRYPEHIAVLEGTKIGGVPSWIQGEEPLAGRFLASLGTISVSLFQPWPFVNVPEPLGWDYDDDHHLRIGDMGSLYLFMDPQGIVRAVSQCY